MTIDKMRYFNIYFELLSCLIQYALNNCEAIIHILYSQKNVSLNQNHSPP